MKRILSIALQVWGAICLVGFLVLVLAILRTQFPNTAPAAPRDTGYVLNWCGLGSERLERVVASYQSDQDPVHGDHRDVHVLQVKGLKESELQNQNWIRGDRLDTVYRDAIRYGSSTMSHLTLSEKAPELFSEKCYLYPWRISLREGRMDMVQLIVACPEQKRVYYFDIAT